MTLSQQPVLALVDGSAYLYRAFHGLPPLNNAEGEPTGAIFGVINMLRRLQKEITYSHLAVIWDSPEKTFRSDLYPEYKANRTVMPEDLQVQVEPLKAAIQAMGIPSVIMSGFEADDIIATLTKQACEKGFRVIISTSDKDLAQLVNPQVTLVNTMAGQTLDEAGVFQKFGVRPDQIIDYLTLVGDTSDNIPGVPSVGPKTAVKWLATFDTLEALVASAETITGKVGEKFRAHIPALALSRELVTVHSQVPLPVGVDNLLPFEPDTEVLRQLFGRFGFKRLQAELPKIVTAYVSPFIVETVLKEDELLKWVERISHAEIISIDTETTSLDALNAELVGISWSLDGKTGVYVPLRHEDALVPHQLSSDYVLDVLKPYLENKNLKKIGQNLKYDRMVLAQQGVMLNGIFYDTMVESYVLTSTQTRHDMDTLAEHYLSIKTLKFREVIAQAGGVPTFAQVPIALAAPYAAQDACVAFQLHEILSKKLQDIPSLCEVCTNIDMPLVSILADMERDGILIDVEKLQMQSAELGLRIAELEAAAYVVAGMTFNLQSPKQLQEVLYQHLKLPVLQKTPTGQASTSEEVLQQLAQNYPLPSVILEHRGLSKLKSTYTDQLPLQADAPSHRVHTSYHQAAVATGRLSSSNPNLQNIPVKTAEGRRIRQAFIARPGCVLLSADYSQIELRIMAHMSGDARLTEAFLKGEDVHRATAAEVFGVPLELVTSDQRRNAKAINFGLMYGMSAFGLAKQLGVGRAEADTYLKAYFARYEGVAQYMEKVRALAHQQGYVETLFGRRVFLVDIQTSTQQQKKAMERAAINAPLQGTAADIIKRAMISVANWLSISQLKTRMLLQVHDELIFEVPAEELDSVKQGVIEHMTQAVSLSVPLVVDVGVGQNWDEAH